MTPTIIIKTWILTLYVFTAGDPSPGGISMGGLPTEDACWKAAARDNKRVHSLYPPSLGAEQIMWKCTEREPLGTVQKLPEVEA